MGGGLWLGWGCGMTSISSCCFSWERRSYRFCISDVVSRVLAGVYWVFFLLVRHISCHSLLLELCVCSSFSLEDVCRCCRHNLLEVLLLRLSSVLLCQVLSGLADMRLDGLYCILPWLWIIFVPVVFLPPGQGRSRPSDPRLLVVWCSFVALILEPVSLFQLGV